VERGQKLFERVWEPGHDAEAGGDGLGPLFNERSCVACHFQGGVGGAGPAQNNVSLLSAAIPENAAGLVGLEARLIHLHPGFASGATLVLHHFSSDPIAYTAFRQKLLGLDLKKGGDPIRKAITVRAIMRKEGLTPIKTIEVEHTKLLLSERNTTPLFGLGLIDSISQAEIEQVAALETNENPRVSGRFVGRFGWRGQTSELADFIRGACAVELGLQVSTQAQAVDPIAAIAKQPASDKLDLTDRQCDDMTAFVARLPAPRRLQPADRQEAVTINNGEHLFNTVGCSVCHRPTLGHVNGIYSDLLVHNMGANLSDPSPAPLRPGSPSNPSRYYGSGPDLQLPTEETLARRQEWKTPPLWGLRDSGPYLHDGRAETVEEAIAYHGGEAADSVDRYMALPTDARTRVLAFLATLAAPESRSLTGWRPNKDRPVPPKRRPPQLAADIAAALR
jgi:CxxC motif-containing protein (DUF1111 family)